MHTSDRSLTYFHNSNCPLHDMSVFFFVLFFSSLTTRDKNLFAKINIFIKRAGGGWRWKIAQFFFWFLVFCYHQKAIYKRLSYQFSTAVVFFLFARSSLYFSCVLLTAVKEKFLFINQSFVINARISVQHAKTSLNAIA